MANHLGIDVESKFDAHQFANSSWVNKSHDQPASFRGFLRLQGICLSIFREKWPWLTPSKGLLISV